MNGCNFGIPDDYFRLKFDEMERKIMSILSVRIAEIDRSFDERSEFILAAVAALRSEVAALKAEAATPEDIAKLDAIDGKIDAFDPTKEATLPEPEPPAE